MDDVLEPKLAGIGTRVQLAYCAKQQYEMGSILLGAAICNILLGKILMDPE